MEVSPRSLAALTIAMMLYGSRSTFPFLILSHPCKDRGFLRAGLLLSGLGVADMPDTGVGPEPHDQLSLEDSRYAEPGTPQSFAMMF